MDKDNILMLYIVIIVLMDVLWGLIGFVKSNNIWLIRLLYLLWNIYKFFIL